MDYTKKQLKSYVDADRISQSSSARQGSLTSDLDDLTVIAEFASDDDELATIYRISNPYEVVGYSVRRSIDKDQERPSSVRNVDKENGFGVNVLNTMNTMNGSDVNIHYPADDRRHLNNIFNNNTVTNDVMLREDDLDSLVKNNISLDNPRKKLTTKEKRAKLKTAGSQTTTAQHSRATSPIDDDINNKFINNNTVVDFLNTTHKYNSILDGRADILNAPNNNKQSTSFFVPLDNDGINFYESNQPLEKLMNIKYTQIQLKDKSSLTSPTLNIIKKETKNVSTMTSTRNDNKHDPFDKVLMINSSTITDTFATKNVAILTDKDESLNNLIQQLKDDLLVETDNLKSKTEQYNSLLDEYDVIMNEMEELKNENESLMNKLSSEFGRNQLCFAKACQTSTSYQSKATQDNLVNEDELKAALQLKDEQVTSMQNELDSEAEKCNRLLDNLKNKNAEIEDLKLNISSLKQDLEEMRNENDYLRTNEDKLNEFQIQKSASEREALEINQKLQNELKKVLTDLDKVQNKLDEITNESDKKESKIEMLHSNLEEYKNKEESLDRIINSLKRQLHDMNDRMSQKFEENAEQDNKETSQIEHEENLLKEISRLMQLNSDLQRSVSMANIHNEDYQDLSRKYNELRNISSRLQTAIAPLKAKLSLANKKCRTKNDFLEGILKADYGNKIPAELKLEIEDNLKDDDHYRALSPLTIDHIERLEHNLINHLHDRLPYFNIRRNSQERKAQSTNDMLASFTQDLNAGDSMYSALKPDISKSLTNLQLISLLDNKNDIPIKDRNRMYEKDISDKGNQFHTNNLLYKRTPILINATSKNKFSNVVNDNKRSFVTNLHSGILESTHASKKSSSPISIYDSSFLRQNQKKTSTQIAPNTDIPAQPKNFQIGEISGPDKKFFFCWEPPLNNLKGSPIIGYELYMNEVKKDYIPGRQTNNYSTEFVSTKSFPLIFALRSITSDGKLSHPSEIILHGLQHLNFDGKENFNQGELFETNSSQLARSSRHTFIAFYDYKSTGYKVVRNGVSYSDLSFETGDTVETFGEILPNGFIFGKVNGVKEVGLIPANFLEKTVV